jgi:cytochrome c
MTGITRRSSFSLGLLLAYAGAGTASAAPASAPEIEAGRKLFAACAACHDPSRANKQGPGLAGIAGRTAGTFPGFRYSGAMRRSHLVWTPENLDAYLANPQGKIPGNTMPYAGLPDAAQRAALIAYLKTL